MSTDIVPRQDAPPVRAAQVEIESQRALAEVKAAVALSKQFPRDEVRAIELILNDCGDPRVAENKALYAYARGGTDITGPSIRLAEIIARRWGNLDVGVRELEQRQGESVVEAYAWDLETNLRDRKVFTVAHVREKKGGARSYLSDPRDIYELVANQGARRKRACILAVIPAFVTNAAVEQIQKTLETKWSPTPERRKAMLAEFSAYGVTVKQIEGRIQRSIDAITAPQMVQLKAVLNALDDKMAVVADFFDVEPAETKGGTQGERAIETLKKNLETVLPPSAAAVPEQVVAEAPGQEPAPSTVSTSPGAEATAAPENKPLKPSERRQLTEEALTLWRGEDAARATYMTLHYQKGNLVELTDAQLVNFVDYSRARAKRHAGG